MNTGSWHPDPTQRHQFRFWDGDAWTDHVSDNGVVGSDPIAAPTVPQPAWMPPTAPTPAAQIPAAVGGAAPRSRTRLWGALLGVVALVAAAVFAVLLLQKDESSDTSATTAVTTAPASTPATTPTTVAATTIAPTTTAPVIDAATLIAAMPTDTEVPAEWSRYREPQELTDTSGLGLCRGPSEVARATQSGGTAVVGGPRWDLPNDGWLGIELILFPTESDASAFLVSTATQADSCTGSPPVWEQSEAEADYFADADGSADGAIWQLTEVTAVGEEPMVNADEDMRVVQQWRSTVTYESVLYSRVERWIYSYERHGRIVIEFWIGGGWGESGWSSFTGAYQPTDADLDAAADVVRAGIVARLAEAGAL